MEIPSYKSYHYLYYYAKTLSNFLKFQNKHIKLKNLFIDFLKMISYEINISTKINTINYPFYITNINEHLFCFIYECNKYKFPNNFTKIIRHLQLYQSHLQKT